MTSLAWLNHGADRIFREGWMLQGLMRQGLIPEGLMRRLKALSCGRLLAALLFLAACLPAVGEAQQPPGATVFEGARVIVGDGSSLDNAAFVVANGRFIAVGRRG